MKDLIVVPKEQVHVCKGLRSIRKRLFRLEIFQMFFARFEKKLARS